MVTFLSTVIVLGVLIFFHELGHFLLAKFLRVRVEAFSLGFPPKLISKKVGETDYRLSVIPLGGYVKLLGENPKDEVPPELQPFSFMHHPLWHRFLIVLAGPGFNMIFAVLAFFLIFSIMGLPYLTTEIGGVKEGSPAARAGLQKGDLILEVGGTRVARWEELSQKVRETGELPLTIRYQRDGQINQVEVVPERMETSDIFGSKVSAILIGVIAPDKVAVEPISPLRAFTEGATTTYRLAVLTVQSLYKLLAREMPLKNLGGPILIAQVAGKQAEMGVANLVHFMAVLSVNLAILNLLPVPILDGGHLFFFLIEAIRGRPVEMKHREMAQAVGLMLLLALMLLVFYQDLLRLFSPHQ
ncbi:MAG: RIP metalloprotease RseP [Deltaproteobacteria bacterium]|nr:RIP metalloprotease RseP [Deltaproteobacteria bacterium]